MVNLKQYFVHKKSTYQYQITASNYNPTIDSEVVITVQVMDYAGDIVANKSVTLYKDGTSVSSSTTNSSGVATWTITLTDWDVHHFKVANATLELKAKGWKTLLYDGSYFIKAKGDLVQFALSVASTSFPTTFTAFGGGAKVPEGYRPNATVVVPCKSDYPLFVAIMTDGTVERRTFNSSQQTAGCYAFCEWTI